MIIAISIFALSMLTVPSVFASSSQSGQLDGRDVYGAVQIGGDWGRGYTVLSASSGGSVSVSLTYTYRDPFINQLFTITGGDSHYNTADKTLYACIACTSVSINGRHEVRYNDQYWEAKTSASW